MTEKNKDLAHDALDFAKGAVAWAGKGAVAIGGAIYAGLDGSRALGLVIGAVIVGIGYHTFFRRT